MAIELTDVKWGSGEEHFSAQELKRRRATEIVSAHAKCSDCGEEWVSTPSHSDLAEAGSFVNGDGILQITCPNGHTESMSSASILPDPR